MFISYNKVRMNDTDVAGILYFANQFRFVHDAWEDLVELENMSFQQIFFNEDFLFVIVHVEADYLAPLMVADKLEVTVVTEKIGNASFTMSYKIYKKDMATEELTLTGTAKTTHVTIDKITRTKVAIPDHLRAILQKYIE